MGINKRLSYFKKSSWGNLEPGKKTKKYACLTLELQRWLFVFSLKDEADSCSPKCIDLRLPNESNIVLQYCAKVMQMNFDEIPAFRGFSKKFCLKRYFNEISPHFRDTYCFDLWDFSNDNSLCSMIHPKFSCNNSLLSKSHCDFSNDNSLLTKVRSIVYQ